MCKFRVKDRQIQIRVWACSGVGVSLKYEEIELSCTWHVQYMKSKNVIY